MSSDAENQYVTMAPKPFLVRMRNRLFPARQCNFPDRQGYHGIVATKTIVYLDLLDRLRILVTGRLVVATKTVTEHDCGNAITHSTAHVATQRQIEGR